MKPIARPTLVLQIQDPELENEHVSIKNLASIELHEAKDELGVVRVDDFEIAIPSGPTLVVACALKLRKNALSLTVTESSVQRIMFAGVLQGPAVFGFTLSDKQFLYIHLTDKVAAE